jgi:hypothetical protein
LLAALTSGETEQLAEAIERATSHSGTDSHGRRWHTSELRAAIDLLNHIRKTAALKERRAANSKEAAAAFAEHLAELTLSTVRELPLGFDGSGRRYWHFAT